MTSPAGIDSSFLPMKLSPGDPYEASGPPASLANSGLLSARRSLFDDDDLTSAVTAAANDALSGNPFITPPESAFNPSATALSEQDFIQPPPLPRLNTLPPELSKLKRKAPPLGLNLTSPSSSSSSSSQPFNAHGVRKLCPSAPVKKRRWMEAPYEATISTINDDGTTSSKSVTFKREHFLNFKFSESGDTHFLSGDGHYKNAYTYTSSSELIPGLANDTIVLLQFKEQSAEKVTSAEEFFKLMDTSLNQYFQAKEAFGADKCVNIYNAQKALEDGYFAVEYIPLSLTKVIQGLSLNLTTPLLSLDDTQNPVVIGVKSILEQIKFFFNKSLKHKIQTDLNIGNFRLSKNDDGSYIVKLTDFREEIDDDQTFGLNAELTSVKRAELNNLRNRSDFKYLISEDLFDEFFKAESDLIDKLSS